MKNDQVCEIPIQDIREDEFKFYYNNAGIYLKLICLEYDF